MLLAIVTIVELAAGFCCAYRVVAFKESTFAELGLILSGLNVLMLFMGQRLTKDYPGAAVLANYFLFAMVLLLFIS